MTELKYPIVFKECPICHLLAAVLQDDNLRCADTIAQLATQEFKDKGKIPKETFTSLEKVITPLVSSTLVAAIPAALCHYDICAKCGMRYCTKVDKIIGMPGPPPGKQPPPFPPVGRG